MLAKHCTRLLPTQSLTKALGITRAGLGMSMFHSQRPLRAEAKTNFADPDASKPTLEIDSFAKAKRLNRPTSPDLSIYQPQLTWVMSGSFRALAAAISGAFYLTAMGFAVLPIDVGMIVDYVHSFPGAVVYLGKVLIGAPFFFHCYNGFRHLV